MLIRIILLVFVMVSCTNDSEPDGTVGIAPEIKDWLVPKEEVLNGGPGKDGIPSIDNPQFDLAKDVSSFFDDELVVGFEYNGVLHGYPIPILDWHEIVNDEINDLSIAITYCPLTGTAIGWERKIGSREFTFGVSGLLYNSNLMPYDRRTNSTWSQQRMECVNGSRIGDRPKTFTLIETTLATWKESFPNSKIMNGNTGFDRRYSIYPYGNYRTNEQLLFPVSVTDERLHAKERVLGVLINQKAKAYRFNDKGNGTDIIQDVISGVDIIVLRSADDNYNTAFLNPGKKQFSPLSDRLPAVMIDSKKNLYDLRGKVIEGPDLGNKLEKPVSMIGFWFSWPPFYPEIEIYGG